VVSKHDDHGIPHEVGDGNIADAITTEISHDECLREAETQKIRFGLCRGRHWFICDLLPLVRTHLTGEGRNEMK
jgi:hypothetical protein